MGNKTITIAEAAKIIGLTEARVRQLWDLGKFVGRKSGGVIMLDRKSVDEYARAYERIKK